MLKQHFIGFYAEEKFENNLCKYKIHNKQTHKLLLMYNT